MSAEEEDGRTHVSAEERGDDERDEAVGADDGAVHGGAESLALRL